MTRRILAALLFSALTAGCTGSGNSILDQFEGGSEPLDPGQGRISGDFGVSSFGLNGSFAWSDRWTNANNQEQGFILLSDDPNVCDNLQTPVTFIAGAEFLLLQVTVVTSNVDAPTEPGDFEIDGSAGNIAFASYAALDANCNTAESVDLTSGTITLTAASLNHFEGTFDGDTAGGDRVRGGFNPINCALDSFFEATSVTCN